MNAYHRPDVELPHLISKNYSKSIQEGIIKEKWELKWAVLTQEVNTFIQGLETSHNELALADISRDERGPLTLLTVNYGETGLSEDYDENGEISWWSYGGGQYTFHVKKWVVNTPEKIKEFIKSCLTTYGYNEDEVTVNCNPIAGEPRVMCEASFTPSSNEEVNYDDVGGGTDENGNEKPVKEENKGIQFNSSIDTIKVPTKNYVHKKLQVSMGEAEKLIKAVEQIDSENLIYRKKGTWGESLPPESGWYRPDDNIQGLTAPTIKEEEAITPETIADCKVAMKDVPDAQFTTIKVTANSVVKSKDKITYDKLKKDFGETGQTTDGSTSDGDDTSRPSEHEGLIPNTNVLITKNPEIEIGGSKMKIPTQCWAAKDSEGNVYPLKVSWLNEGLSFDADKVKNKYSTDKRVFYEGEMVKNYRTIAVFAPIASCVSNTNQQTL